MNLDQALEPLSRSQFVCGTNDVGDSSKKQYLENSANNYEQQSTLCATETSTYAAPSNLD